MGNWRIASTAAETTNGRIREREAVARARIPPCSARASCDVRHVGLVNRGDVRRDALAQDHVLGDLGPHAAHGLDTRAGRFRTRHGSGRLLRSVDRRDGLRGRRSRRYRRSSGNGRDGRAHLRHGTRPLRRHIRLQILFGDTSARASASYLAKIDAVLPRHLADQRRERPIGRFCFRVGHRLRFGRARRCLSRWCRRRWRSGGRLRGLGCWRGRWRSGSLPHRRRRSRSAISTRFVNASHHRAD